MNSATTSRARTVIAPIVFIALLVTAWQWVAYNLRSVLPKVEDMFAALVENLDMYLKGVGSTAWMAAVGFLIGTIIALILAALITYFGWLRAAILPVATMLHVTPIVAIAPALIVAFGFGPEPKIIVAAISAFFPTLINAIAGFANVDPQAEEVFGAMSASKWETFLRLRLPSSLPMLFAGAQVAVTGAVVGQVVAEFMGSAVGLGAIIVTAQSYLALAQMWVAIFLAALLSLAGLGLVNLAQKLVIRW